MNRTRLTLAFALVAFAGAAEPAPAINWVLPLFTDKEGYRSLIARGSQVTEISSETIAVTDMSLTIFSGDAKARVDTVFLSPVANFFAREQRASGDRTVRILRDDMEASGQRWSYDHERKHVTLEGEVRIVFNAELKDLLK